MRDVLHQLATELLSLMLNTEADTVIAMDESGNSIQASVTDFDGLLDGLERLELAGYSVTGIARRGLVDAGAGDVYNAPTPGDYADVSVGEDGTVTVSPDAEWLGA